MMNSTLIELKNSIRKIESNQVTFLYFNIDKAIAIHPHYYLPLSMSQKFIICLPIFSKRFLHKRISDEEMKLKRKDKSLLTFKNGIFKKDESDSKHSATIKWDDTIKIKISDLKIHLKDKQIIRKKVVVKESIDEIYSIFKYKRKNNELPNNVFSIK